MFRFTLFSIVLFLIGNVLLSAQEPDPAITAAEAGRPVQPALSARPDEKVLVASLEHLDIVGDASLPPPEHYDTPVFLNDAPPILETAEFVAVLNGFLYEPISRQSLDRLRNAVRLFLASTGYPFSLVYWPEQDITDGRLRLVVRSSEVGQVKVQGNRWFSTDSYLRRLGLSSGDRLNQYALRVGSEALNLSEYRNVSVKLKRGIQPGTSDIVIITQERKPWMVYAGYSNTGTMTTGEDRLTAGATWGAMFGSDQSMSVNWSSDPQARYAKSLSGTWVVPVGGVKFSLFGSYSETAAKVAAPLKQEGTSWQVGLNYDRELESSSQRYEHSFSAGLDFKSSDNNLDYILPPIVFPISGNLTEIVQARVRYTGTLQDKWGYTRGSAELVGSPGGLSGANHTSDFSQTRAGATADYLYVKGDFFRNNNLRGGLAGWNWTQRIAWQLSANNLLGSEQFSAGGSGTVRGYEEGEVIGDNGFLFSQELLFPSFSPLNKGDALRSFVFHDFAVTENTDKLPGEGSFTVHSVGAGFRYQVKNHLSASLAYGWQLRDSGNSSSTDSGRAHFSLQLSY